MLLCALGHGALSVPIYALKAQENANFAVSGAFYAIVVVPRARSAQLTAQNRKQLLINAVYSSDAMLYCS
jgi:hypothetical protein